MVLDFSATSPILNNSAHFGLQDSFVFWTQQVKTSAKLLRWRYLFSLKYKFFHVEVIFAYILLDKKAGILEENIKMSECIL